MNLVASKTRKFILFLIKILIVGGAIYFIYHQIAHNEKLDWKRFIVLFDKNQSVLGIAFLLSLSIINRYFEILKWKHLVATFKPITLSEATKQVLAALTAGLFTPNGIGEYAGKAFYFDKKDTKTVIFLNIICNGIQVLIALLFGLFSFLYFNSKYTIISVQTLCILLGILLSLVLTFFVFKKFSVKGYSILKFIKKINEIPKVIYRKVLLFGFLRYGVLMHQYYFLFVAFDVHLPYILLIATLSTVYFLASSLPSFQFLDFAVKGSVGVYFFGILGVNEWIVVFISTLIWFLNVVLPVLIGSYYVLNFKITTHLDELPLSKKES